MRAFIAAFVIVLALVAICEASLTKGAAHRAEKLMKALKHATKPHSPLKKLHAHRFATLEDGPKIPSCAAAGFNETVVKVMTACANGGLEFLNMDKGIDPSNATALAQLDAWCAADKCGGELVKVAENAEYMKCLAAAGGEIVMGPLMAKLACLKVDNVPCFATLSSLGDMDNCEWAWNATDCATRGSFCSWDVNEKRCYANATQAVKAICSSSTGKCVDAVVNVVKDLPFAEGFGEIQSMFSIMCHQYNGEYCLPAIGSLINEGEHEGSNDDLGELRYVCNNPVQFGCIRSIAPKLQEMQRGEARRHFYECVKNVNNKSDLVDMYCKPSFMYNEMEAAGIDHYLNLVCARSAKGEWCVAAFERYDDLGRDCIEPVIRNATEGKACNAKCDGAIKAAFDDLGCCVGTSLALSKPPKFNESSYPPYVANGTSNMTKPMLNGTTNMTQSNYTDAGAFAEMMFRQLAICPSVAVGLNATLSAQCAAVSQITTVDPCYSSDFRAVMEALKQECSSNVTDVIEHEFSTTTAATAAFAQFCNSSCVKTAKRALEKFPRCIDPSMAQSIRGGLVLCEKAPNGEHCGVQASLLRQGDCERLSESACKTAAQCTWIAATSSNQYSRCDIQPTAAYLESVCSPCLVKIANALGDSSDAKEASQFQQFVCARVDDKFCFPLVAADIRSADALGFSNASLQALCSNSTKDKCISKMMAGAASTARREAEDEFRKCVERSYDQRSANQCVDYLRSHLRQLQQLESQVNFLCRRNANGEFCLALMQAAENNTCLQSVFSGSCSTACDTELKALVDSLGCCAGNIHQMVGTLSVRAEDVPVPRDAKYRPEVNFSTAPAGTAPSVAPTEQYFANVGNASDNRNGLFLFNACPSLKSTLEARVHVGCGVKRGELKVEKKKPLPISYEYLEQNPDFQKQLLERTTKDMAAAGGFKESDVVNPHFERDATVKVKTNSRRMRAQAEASGSVYVFTLQASSDADTQAAASSFDKAVSSDELLLPSATALTKDCGCMDETATSLAVEAAPIVAPEPVNPVPAPTNSTSGAVAASIAAAAACIVAVMLL